MQAARRGPHLAVPALLQRPHAGLAAAPRRPGRPSRRGLDGAADPEADQHQRRGLPRRRHPDRQLRARRRLAARRARQDRQARLRRQLRAWPRPAARCPSSRWSPCCRRRRAARQAKAGSSWLGSPPVLLRRPAGSGDDSRTYDPPRRLRIARGLVECCRLVAVMVDLRCWPAASCSSSSGCSTVRCPWLALVLAGPRADGRRRAGGRASPSAAKWLLVGRHPGHRAPAVELVRLAQRAGRHLRRGGGRAVVRAGRDRHAAAQRLAAARSARRSAAACGARPTGCPSPTSSSCATASPSTRAAWCRPTSSTTGC